MKGRSFWEQPAEVGISGVMGVCRSFCLGAAHSFRSRRDKERKETEKTLMVKALKELVEWYWKFGVNRGEYTIQPIDLYSIYKVLERQRAMEAAKADKPCVAFWGPSQSGKSSSVESYIDGDGLSAIVWKEDQKIRKFSKGEGSGNENDYFNPRNGNDDASALVTRFYLPSSEDEIDKSFPVQLIPASRKHILMALTEGYIRKCESVSSYRRSRGYGNANQNVKLEKESFGLLCDLCDVCKLLSMTEGKFQGFNDQSRIEKIISSGPSDDISKTWKFVADILWDGSVTLCNVAERISGISGMLRNYETISATMTAAAFLEDMSKAVESAHLLIVEESADKKHLRIRCSDEDVKTEDGWSVKTPEVGLVGEFQASIGEIRIPLNPRHLKDTPFKAFLKDHHLIDIPGVTNWASGTSEAKEKKLSLWDGDCDKMFERLTEAEKMKFYKEVYKTGMTFSVVYGCSVDSFVIFYPTGDKGGIRESSLFSEAIKAWIEPYNMAGEPYDDNFTTPLDLFINFGLFSDRVVDTLLNQNGLRNTNQTNELPFSRWKGIHHFFTTNSFNANTMNAEMAQRIIDEDVKHVYIRNGLEEDEDALVALTKDHLGTDYMFTQLQEIKKEKRWGLHGGIVQRDLKKVCDAVGDACPAQESAEEKRLNDALREVRTLLNDIEKKAESKELKDQHDYKAEKRQVADFVKTMIDITVEVPMLMCQNGLGEEAEVRKYLDKCIAKWKERKAKLGEKIAEGKCKIFAKIDITALMDALACFKLGIVKDIQSMFAFVHSEQAASEVRATFSLALANMFMTGTMQQYDSLSDMNGYRDKIKEPVDLIFYAFKKRIEECKVNPSRRDYEAGDDEIREIMDNLTK